MDTSLEDRELLCLKAIFKPGKSLREWTAHADIMWMSGIGVITMHTDSEMGVGGGDSWK